MNENLDNQIAAILKKGLEVAGKTDDFVMNQAPELLREFYAWHITSSILWIFISVFLIYSVFKLSNLFGFTDIPKNNEEGRYKRVWGRYFRLDSWGDVKDDIHRSFVMFRVTGYCLGFFILFFNVSILIKIIIAPKIYLIEYFLN